MLLCSIFIFRVYVCKCLQKKSIPPAETNAFQKNPKMLESTQAFDNDDTASFHNIIITDYCII